VSGSASRGALRHFRFEVVDRWPSSGDYPKPRRCASVQLVVTRVMVFRDSGFGRQIIGCRQRDSAGGRHVENQLAGWPVRRLSAGRHEAKPEDQP
jgi:hypothetical protein